MLKPIMLLAAIAFAAPVSAATVSATDRAALEQLKAANDSAWNRKDAATMQAQYVAEATIRVAPQAELVIGQQAVGDFFKAAFARRQGDFRHITSLAHMDALDGDTVLSEGDVRVEKREGNGNWTLVRRFRTISIAVRHGTEWKLRSVRAIPLS